MGKTSQSLFKKDERGVVSIVLTVFVLIVLSLVVVAFSQNTRREQRQSLDRQLSAQAYYAAESGVNQVISLIRANQITVTKTDDCNTGVGLLQERGKLDGNGQGAFNVTCALFDTTPPTVQWTTVDTIKGQFTSLQTADNNLNKLKVSWKRSDGGTNSYEGCTSASAVATIPTSAADYSENCGAGMLRINLIPYQGGYSREQLYDGSYTVYLRPTRDAAELAATIAYQAHSAGPNTQGQIIPAYCGPDGMCHAMINGVPAGGSVFMQARSLYYNNTVTVAGLTNADAPVRFSQAQVAIDVTGRATDVLKRVQVRMPRYESYTAPANVLDVTSGICKRLAIYPAVGAEPGRADNSECDISG